MAPSAVLGGALLAGVAVLAAVLAVFSSDYVVLVTFRILEYAALAQAWNLLAGYGGLVSLGSAAFIGLGMYGMAKLVDRGGFGGDSRRSCSAAACRCRLRGARQPGALPAPRPLLRDRTLVLAQALRSGCSTGTTSASTGRPACSSPTPPPPRGSSTTWRSSSLRPPRPCSPSCCAPGSASGCARSGTTRTPRSRWASGRSRSSSWAFVISGFVMGARRRPAGRLPREDRARRGVRAQLDGRHRHDRDHRRHRHRNRPARRRPLRDLARRAARRPPRDCTSPSPARS